MDHGVERERRRQERTERRCFGAMSVVLRYLTLVTLVTQMGSAVEGVGVAHRSLLNTGNPDAKRLYDDLLSNYNKLVRPVVNTTDPLTVRIKLKLSQLIDVVRMEIRSPLLSSYTATPDLSFLCEPCSSVGCDIDSISATTATMSKLWKGGRRRGGGREDTVTSVMIGTHNSDTFVRS